MLFLCDITYSDAIKYHAEHYQIEKAFFEIPEKAWLIHFAAVIRAQKSNYSNPNLCRLCY